MTTTLFTAPDETLPERKKTEEPEKSALDKITIPDLVYFLFKLLIAGLIIGIPLSIVIAVITSIIWAIIH